MSKDSRQKTSITQPIDWEQAQSVLKLLKTDENYNTLLMFAFGFYFGLRISDILNIRWNQIMELNNGLEITVFPEFEVKEIKTGKFRPILIHEDVKRLVRLSYEMQPLQPPLNQFIFIYNRCDADKDKPITVEAANKRIRNAFLKYGILTANPSSHTLRKTFALRVWDNAGKTDEALIYLSEILNHSSTRETRKYIGITKKVIGGMYLSV